MRIVFMGTPEFAVPSLELLLRKGHKIVGVLTAPDRPSGRGQELAETAVKKFAVSQDLYVLQPEKLKDPAFLETLKSLDAELQVVVAFRMLPQQVWAMPPKGTINLHGSLLPQYRGAAPINRAIMNGEAETGVTTFFLNENIDTGNILSQKLLDIGPSETAGELHDRMMLTGADLVLETVDAILTGHYTETTQPQVPPADLKTAPKLLKEDTLINWDQEARVIFNHIRGLSPYPSAYTYLQEKQLKIYKASFPGSDSTKDDAKPGTFDSDGKTFLRVRASDRWLDLQEIQLESKKKMQVVDFLKGYRF